MYKVYRVTKEFDLLEVYSSMTFKYCLMFKDVMRFNDETYIIIRKKGAKNESN